ncbi:YhdP family protein [Luteimonas sp. RD2P54]|uniref:YhdP family protein n=1 Tax=Luteimonas endophytica TaxID=3042023 RepID=A0ABT6J9Y1_9GAMM|nr:YhdP family protein [Luteimonas endophytica]MDH5823385.1 YhdP family protein [Luteimonas endophytica]
MSLLRRRLRVLRRVLWLALAMVLVLMALAAGITSQMLPLVERHPDRVAAWLGDRVGREVGFDALETEWTRRGPLLRLDGLRIGAGADAVQVGAAEILVAQYAGMLPGRSLTELRLRDLELVLERAGDGRWSVRGLPGQGRGGGDPFAALERLGELHVIGGSLTVLAPELDIDATVPRIDLRLRVDGDRVRAATRAWMAADREPVHAVLDVDRGGGDGRAYAALRDADFEHWAPLLRFAGVAVDGGHGRAEAWATLQGNRVAALGLDATLEGIGLRSTRAAGAAPARVDFAAIRTRLRWTDTDEGWRIDVPLLRIGSRDDERILDGLLLAAGERYAFAAERLDAGPALALLALSDAIPAGLRTWLREARPGAVLADVELAGERGGALRLHARIEDLGFAAAGDRPGVGGVKGRLHGSEHGLVLAFDPRAAVRVDWPRGFGAAHEIALRGDLVAWREAGGWQVQTPALRIDGDGYGADVRGGLRFEGGGRPRIDLAARLDDAHVSVAKRFWVRHRMSAAAIDWLDAALVDGTVRNARAVVSGDLDDWPFRAAGGGPAPGLFHAEGELAGLELKFQPDWPAAEGLAGTVRFVADGFDVRGRGALGDVVFEGLEGGIAHFGRAPLRVEAGTATDAAALLALLRSSPLEGVRGAALDQLQVAGAVDADFAMALPLRGNGGGPRIDGRVRLRGVRARMPDWGLALDEVRGEARYDQRGFAATRLSALQHGRAARLALRAGEGHVRDPGQAFEGELRAPVEAAELLARAPELAWLRPHVRGVSDWTIAVAVPAAGTRRGAVGATRLSLVSDLAGTVLELPAPLDKPAATALPARIETPLPLGDGELSVRLGARLALRSRGGTSVMLGGAAAPAPPGAGLAIGGRTAALDALEWTALAVASSDASSPGSGAGDGPVLQRIDLRVDRLLLFGGVFAQTRIRGAGAGPGAAATLRLEGPALAGTVDLAGGPGAALAGRLQRLHWRPAVAPGAAAARADTAAGDVAESADGMDPQGIPPIDLRIADLRVRDVELGEASLRTRPAPGGLRLEQLRTRSPRQRIDASGAWTGRGASARTGLALDVVSEDFGELLGGLGLAGRIRGGEGELQLQGAWPGSPAGFRAERLRGSLALRVKDGQLVEIEPGAGRVLGLLSLAELPRRLTLDFSDFFEKGFAFNRIGGEVRFDRGQARSEDLVIDGPAAQIRIAGSADLRAQTYDQTIDVLPKSGNLLAAVGAIAAGPVGAAVGAVANAVLRKPLGELGATTYRVSGPWSEPKVEVIRREPARVAGQDAAPSDG